MLASADHIKIGDIWYELDSETMEAEVVRNWDENYIGEINVPSTVTHGANTYTVTSIGKNTYSMCEKLTSITMPEKLDYIGDMAFNNCKSLTSVIIPEGITTIGYSTVYNCSSLESIVFPEGVISIGYDAFRFCTKLTSITFPKSLKNIYDNAFRDCTALTSVYCYAEERPEADGYAFLDSYDGATLYVPEKLIPYYRSEVVWNSFPNIVAIETAGIDEILETEGNISVIYDLAGRKQSETDIKQLPKGIYIVDGRKVVVK